MSVILVEEEMEGTTVYYKNEREKKVLEGFLQNAKNNAKITFKNVKPTKLKHRVIEAERKLKYIKEANPLFE